MSKYFKYNYQKIFLWLSCALVISVFIIIRDCQVPILHVGTDLDRYIDILFLKTTNDYTIYNIAISYVAAYIFYIIQVYIPAVLDNKHGMSLLRDRIVKDVNCLKILLLVIEYLTEKKDEILCIKGKEDKIYIVEDKQKEIFLFTFTKTYEELKEMILSNHNDLLNNWALAYLDSTLSELIVSIPIDNLFSITDNIYYQQQKKIRVDIVDNNSVVQTKSSISVLEQVYGFSFDEYFVEHDINIQSVYISKTMNSATYARSELEIRVRLNENEDF